MACMWAHTPFYALVTAAPVGCFLGYLGTNARASVERLSLAGSTLLWAAYFACWSLPSVAVARLLLEFTSSSLTAWNALAVTQTFTLCVSQVTIISLLLHGYLGVTYKAAHRTLVTALTVAGGDAALRVLLMCLGIPLYYIRMCSSLSPPPAPPPLPPLDPPPLPSPTTTDTPPTPATLLSHMTAAAMQALLNHNHLPHHEDSHQGTSLPSYEPTAHAQLSTTSAATAPAATPDSWTATGTADHHHHPLGSHHRLPDAAAVTSALSRLLSDLVLAWQDLEGFADGTNSNGPNGGTSGTQRSMAGGPQCLRHRWAAWSLHLTLCTLLALSYALLLLLPFTPLRDLLPARRALTRYLVVLAGVYWAASLGALLAGCGVAGGGCVWALAQWLLQVGLGPLLWVTFLAGPLAGPGGFGGGLDEDLLMFSEMRDAGVLDDDDGVSSSYY